MKIIEDLKNGVVKAICGCGKSCVIKKDYLSHCKRKKKIPLCKDCQKIRKSEMSRNHFDLSKYFLKKYGKLLLTGSYFDEEKHRRMFVWVCDCGKQYICNDLIKKSIFKGDSISCGCHRLQNASKMGLKTTTHGNTSRDEYGAYKTPAYKNWDKIMNCCRKGWKREVHKVCHEYDTRWNKFEEFLKDFGILKDKQIVSRLDNQMPWSKENCFIKEVFK